MTRTTTFAAAVAIAALAFAPAVASAQSCLGMASYANGSIQLGAGAQFDKDVTTYGAGIGIGAAKGGFINGLIGMADYDNTDESTTIFGVSGGWQLPVGTAATGAQFCPIASFQYASGPNNVTDPFGDEIDISGRDLAVGLAFGAPMTSGQALSVVPFGSVSYHNFSMTIDGGVLDGTEDDNYGQADLGVGFVANEWITVRPAVSIPFAEPDGLDLNTVFSIQFAFNFGKAR
jgi:hypothetical protein